jgi:hypothetical protein
MLTLVGGGVAIAAETETRNPLVLLGATLSLVWGLVTYDLREAVLAAGLAATLAVVAIVMLRGRRPRLLAADGYLLFALLVLVELTVLAEGTTLGSGGGFVSQRLALFPVYGAVLWLAARGAGQRAMQLTAVVALVVASGFLVLRLPSYIRLSDLATAYVGVEACLARDATMVQANLWLVDPGPLVRTDPLTNEAGRVSAPTGGWDLGNLDASVALFPIRNRPGNDPFRWLRDTGRSMQEVPPAMDPERYAQVTGQTVDYVLVYGRANAAGGDLEHPRWLRLLAQLEGGYRLVATSSDGLLEAWELQADPVAGRGAAQRAAQPAGTCRPG